MKFRGKIGTRNCRVATYIGANDFSARDLKLAIPPIRMEKPMVKVCGPNLVFRTRAICRRASLQVKKEIRTD